MNICIKNSSETIFKLVSLSGLFTSIQPNMVCYSFTFGFPNRLHTPYHLYDFAYPCPSLQNAPTYSFSQITHLSFQFSQKPTFPKIHCHVILWAPNTCGNISVLHQFHCYTNGIFLFKEKGHISVYLVIKYLAEELASTKNQLLLIE